MLSYYKVMHHRQMWKCLAKNSKTQFRSAHSMVIAARIISYNLKVDWNLQNKCESRIEDGGSWSIFAQPFSRRN